MGDYSSDVVRYLTYPERLSIDDFDIDVRDTYDAAFYTVLFGIQEADATLLNEKSLCKIFNDAYYIVTLSLMQSHPECHLNLYYEIAKGENDSIRKSIENESVRVAIVMGIVVAFLEGFRHKGYDTDTERLALHICTWSQKDGKCMEIVERMKKAVAPHHYNQLRCPCPRDFAPLPLDTESVNSITWENMLTLQCNENGPWEVAEYEAEWLLEDIAGKDEERKKELVDLIIEYFKAMSKTERGINQSDNYKAYLRKFYSIKGDLYQRRIPVNDPFGDYMGWPMATEEDIDDIFKDDQSNIENQKEENEQLLQQIAKLKSEVNQLSKENADLRGNLSNALYEVERLKEENNIFQKYLGTPKIVLINNSNFARVVQAMVSARYFKRANGDETNATEVGGLLLKLFGVTNTWKSVLQKAYSRENPLKTFDELRDAGEKYWTNRTGLTKEIRKKGKK